VVAVGAVAVIDFGGAMLYRRILPTAVHRVQNAPWARQQTRDARHRARAHGGGGCCGSKAGEDHHYEDEDESEYESADDDDAVKLIDSHVMLDPSKLLSPSAGV
jgi:hypothetical protein